MNEKISVLMSIYKNDKPEWLKIAVESVVNQTYKPDEIVLIIDGPVSDELNNMVEDLKKSYDILNVHPLKENIGLGRVLEMGVPMCKNEYIARMDSDDISMPNRFETQLKVMDENDLDIVGSYTSEFCDDPEQILSIREVPLSQEDIKNYIKGRNPYNHPTVMMKKSACIAAGGYQHMHYCEDYYLWCRMLLSGAKMANIAESLVKMRVNNNTYKRRGGYKYFKSQKQLFKFMRKNGILSFPQYVKTLAIRFVVHVLMPSKLKEKFYKNHLRKNNNGQN